MSLIEQAILIGAAAWRLTALLSYERGPFDIFLKFRESLGFQHADNGEPNNWPENLLTNLISCPWCLGIYATVGIWGLWQLSQVAVIVIAASSFLIVLERWNHGSNAG